MSDSNKMESTGAENTVPQNTATQKYMKFGNREIILVGTAHVSQESIDEVTAVIEKERPENVAIELDEKRLANMKDPEAWRKMDIIKVLKNKQGFLMMANIILASYQKKMGKAEGVQPGDEMLAAMNKADELGIPQTMVDRQIAVTLRRAWAMNGFWGKCKLLAALISSAFSKEQATPEEIENLKKGSEMDSMMNELSDYLPKVKQVLIDERDRYLASKIWETKGNKVLAVLGAGHLPGVQAYLEKLASGQAKSDVSDIDFVPPKKTFGKIVSWLIPVLIVLFIIAGFIFGGQKKGWEMLSSWVLWNGLLAAVGALIAGGHPLAVLVSLVGAPFTSLCPFVGIGLVSGIVQAAVVKPTVADMESLSESSNSLKGFYKNRILRVLLVFILSSLGSTVGTFVAGASFVAAITSFFDKIVEWVKGVFFTVVDWFKNIFSK